MGDKDIPNIFNGKQEIMLFNADSDPTTAVPLSGVVEDSLSITSEEDLGEEPTLITAGSWKVDLSDWEFDSSVFDKFLGGSEPRYSVFVRPVQIKFPYEPLRKPSNLKYPHKRRKIRVLKKWCKRYGYKHPASIFIPNATITTELDPNTFSIRCHISSKD